MNTGLAIVLCLLTAAIVMFAINRPRMDVVALLMLVALPLTGVIKVSDALAGFSDPNIVLIAALFVVGEGLVRTGVAQSLGDWLIHRAGGRDTLLLILLMVVVCILGATMSSTAVAAIFIPVALRISKNTGTAANRLMMPLSVAALISGMTTLIATAPNLVVNSELERNGQRVFSFFDFTPFGIVILIVGIIYMLFARRLLPAAESIEGPIMGKISLNDWVNRYKLAKREFRFRVSPSSSLLGKTIEELGQADTFGAQIIAIDRKRKFANELIRPTPKMTMEAGDVLLVDIFQRNIDISSIAKSLGLEILPLSGAYFNDRSQELGMAEVIVPADSALVGKNIKESAFRTRYGLTVIGLRHGRQPLESGIMEDALRTGDTLLVVGDWKSIENVSSSGKDLILFNLPIESAEVLPAPGKAWLAVACLLLMILLMVTQWVPNVTAALIACLLMGVLGCIDLQSAYASISWKTLILIVGMLPFSIALRKTGGVDLAAHGMMYVMGDSGPYVILTCLFAITALLGMFISNTATAVLMAPVAIRIAEDLNFRAQPFAMIVALAASTAFMTPVSSPVNTLVVGPGNYSFGDFIKIGVPLSIIVMIICVALVPALLPL